jgi:hypothetical protein
VDRLPQRLEHPAVLPLRQPSARGSAFGRRASFPLQRRRVREGRGTTAPRPRASIEPPGGPPRRSWRRRRMWPRAAGGRDRLRAPPLCYAAGGRQRELGHLLLELRLAHLQLPDLLQELLPTGLHRWRREANQTSSITTVLPSAPRPPPPRLLRARKAAPFAALEADSSSNGAITRSKSAFPRRERDPTRDFLERSGPNRGNNSDLFSGAVLGLCSDK